MIEQQVRRGEYISRHLRGGAIDVRTFDLTPAQQAELERIVRAEGESAIRRKDRHTCTSIFHDAVRGVRGDTH